jgi:glutamine synthetase
VEKIMSYNCKLEYLWLDGHETPNIRSKTRYINLDTGEGFLKIDQIPEWGFDGSSTEQASGDSSDCVLKPVSLFNNTVDTTVGSNSYIVMCEVYNVDGTPHESNTRAELIRQMESIDDDRPNGDFWFGIEQEYTLIDTSTGRPYGWPDTGYPEPQGRYYCGVGGDVVKMRDLVHEHAMCCISAGIPLCGTNAEVMLSQWEYQIGPSDPVKICDYLWVSRFMLEVLAEMKGVGVSLKPKHVEGDWNGSGAHINFSTKHMRENTEDEEYIESVCTLLEAYHNHHIKNYGVGNENRLTGKHETQRIDKFSYGKSDRGASIRIPSKGGYLEDRRPASNMDPYKAVRCLVESVSTAYPAVANV